MTGDIAREALAELDAAWLDLDANGAGLKRLELAIKGMGAALAASPQPRLTDEQILAIADDYWFPDWNFEHAVNYARAILKAQGDQT